MAATGTEQGHEEEVGTTREPLYLRAEVDVEGLRAAAEALDRLHPEFVLSTKRGQRINIFYREGIPLDIGAELMLLLDKWLKHDAHVTEMTIRIEVK